MKSVSLQIESAVETLKRRGIIAYPTEAVYGLGCDPLFEEAVQKILSLKNRKQEKGFILVAHDFNLLRQWVGVLPDEKMKAVFATWPGPVTWLFPAAPWVPAWVRGKHDTLAIRVSDHPVVVQLTCAYGQPLISTSANPEGLPPAVNAAEVKHYFDEQVDYIVQGKTGGLAKPTTICDALTGDVLR